MSIRRLAAGLLAGGLVALFSLACTTFHDELARGQRAFEQEDHDRTLAILRDLEPDVKRLTPPEQVEYAYLRGMTDYRVGYKADARHWLAVAKSLEEQSPGMMPVDWKDKTNEALVALNDVVYSQGTSGLTTSRVAAEETANKPKDTPSKSKGEQDSNAVKDARGAKEAKDASAP